MMLWAPFVTGVVIGGVAVGLMAVGGVLRKRETWATTMVAFVPPMSYSLFELATWWRLLSVPKK